MTDIDLIIRIPEEIRLALIHNIQLSPDQKSIRDSYTSQAIICGKPLDAALDKIRKEIEELDGKYVIGDYAAYRESSPKYVRLWEVLQILNKYRTGQKARTYDKV